MAPLSTILTSVGAAGLAARGFSYHDNAVTFSGGINWVVGGSFTVRDLMISAGQDPQTVNHIGDVHTMTNDSHNQPTLTFTAGRHKTSEVAAWWNQRVPASQNSFGHTAGQLNFAFIGDLTLDLIHPQSTQVPHLYIPSVGLAQGSDDNGSNWWFGGSTCTHGINDGEANCIATDDSGQRYNVEFFRGPSTDINQITMGLPTPVKG